MAYANNLLTVFYAGGNKLYADDITQRRLSAIFTDVMRRYNVRSNTFILSGFEHPDRFPIQPQAVFTVDAPIDIFTIYTFLEDIAGTRYTHNCPHQGRPRSAEGERGHLLAPNGLQHGHHVWSERALSCQHVKHRNQTVHHSNYEVTAELINRLVLMGNTRAEFMQSFRTGYRANGMRHPHSWSIVDEAECVQWIKHVLGGEHE